MSTTEKTMHWHVARSGVLIKLLEIALKGLKRVNEWIVRQIVKTDNVQFVLMKDGSTTDAIFRFLQLQEKYLTKKK